MIENSNIPELSFYITQVIMQAILKEWLDPQVIHQMYNKLHLNTHEEKIFFLTHLTMAIRKYPDTVFSNPDLRTQFLNVIQEHLDAHILEENDSL